ncbi:unnamed protein product [Cunninghamella echinulata]
METHYQVLNVSCDASFSEIKQQFQQLIIEHHPDKQNLLLKDKDEIELNIFYRLGMY